MNKNTLTAEETTLKISNINALSIDSSALAPQVVQMLAGQELQCTLQNATNTKFSSCQFSQLELRQLVFKNCIFSQCVFDATMMKSVRFENCQFNYCRVEHSSFLNCQFIGCSWKGNLIGECDINLSELDEPTVEHLLINF